MRVLAANWIMVHLQTNKQTQNNLNRCYDWNKMRKSNVFLFIFKVMLISLLHNIKYTLRPESCSKLWSLNLWGLYGCCCSSITLQRNVWKKKVFFWMRAQRIFSWFFSSYSVYILYYCVISAIELNEEIYPINDTAIFELKTIFPR